MADDHEIVVSSRLEYEVDETATMVCSIAASRLGQHVVDETFQVDRDDVELVELTDRASGRLHGMVVPPGPLSVRYEARIRSAPVEQAGRVDVEAGVPAPELLPMLRPSRYAQSDRVSGMATALFGGVPAGGDRALAVAEWVHENIAYVSGATDASDSALETVLARAGVCRDFAHLTTAFCRALGIPTRYVSVYAPLLDPPDFHAVVEVHLGGRWWLLDPTRLAPRQSYVRIAHGRDAADCAFATVISGAIRPGAVEVAAHTTDAPPVDDHTALVRRSDGEGA